MPLHTITAIITAKPGREHVVRDALRAVADAVRANEPETLSFFVSEDQGTPRRFVTHERFASEAAMALHNTSAASKGFFSAAGDAIEGPVILVSAQEIAAK